MSRPIGVYEFHTASRDYQEQAKTWFALNGVDLNDIFEFELLDDGTVRLGSYRRGTDGKYVTRDGAPIRYERIIQPKTPPPLPT